MSITGAIGTDIGTVTITNSGGTTFGGTVTASTVTITDTTGTVAFDDVVSIATLNTDTQAYNVAVNTSGSSITNAVTFSNTGTVALGSSGGTQTYAGGITATAPSATTLRGVINTTNTPMNFGAITLGANTTLNTNATTNAGDITIGSVTGSTYTLTLATAQAVTGADVTGTSFSGTGTLALQNIGGTASFTGALTVADLTVANSVNNVSLTGNGGMVSNAVTFANIGTLVLGSAGNTQTYNAGITATAPSAITTAGTLVLGGTSTLGDGDSAITLSSATTLSTSASGTTTVGGAIGSSNIDLTVTGAGNSNIDGVIDLDSGALTKSGAGTLTLMAANTYAGSTTVSAGTLSLGANNVISDSSAVEVNGGTLALGAYSDTVGAVTFGADGGSITSSTGVLTGTSYTFNNTSAASISAILAGSASLEQAASGTTTLAAANTYSGGTTISNGLLMADIDSTVVSGVISSGAFGTGNIAIASGAALDLNGSLSANNMSIQGSGISSSGVLYNSSNSQAIYSGQLTLTGDITIKSTRALTLNNDINGSHALVLVATGAGDLTVSGSLGSVAPLNSLSTSQTSTGRVLLTGGSVSTSGSQSYSSEISLARSLSLTSTAGSISLGSITLSGSTSNLLIQAAGNINLSASKSIQIAGGTITLQSDADESGLGYIKLASTSSITSNGGAIVLGGGSNPLTGYAVGSSDNAAGITLNKATIDAGAGAVTLNGKGYSLGGIGVYILGNDTASSSANNSGIQTTTGNISINAYGISNPGLYLLKPNTYLLSSSGNIAIESTGAVEMYYTSGASGTSPRIVTAGSGGVHINASGAITINSSYIQVANGDIDITASGAVTQIWGGRFVSTGTGDISITSTGGNINLGGNSAGGVWADGTGSITANAQAITISNELRSSVGANLTASGQVKFTLDAGDQTNLTSLNIIADTSSTVGLSPNVLTLQSGGTLSVDIGSNSSISTAIGGDNVSFTKVGSGALTLSGANTYTGTTTVSAGTLNVTGTLSDSTAVTVAADATYIVGSDDTVASITGTGNIALTANLTAGGAGDTTFSGVMSSTGNFTKAGSGTTTLSNNNTYTGTTTVSAGTLLISNDTGLGSTLGSTLVQSGATLDLYNVAVGNEQVTLNGGTLKDVTSSLSGNVILTADSFLSADLGNTLTLSGVISGSYGITKVGAGAVVLSNNNTYTGTTTVSAGTLSVTGTLSDSTAVTVAADAAYIVGATDTVASIAGAGNITLTGNLTAGSATDTTFSGVMSSTGSFTKVGSGTLTLSGANT
ncbi:beta strand repeat-containing protein [Polynucleobacter necessarius]|uniref:beta strand repeat-containing protein n=1 Tax=Polynucleobacter necessarius TaxID=576610 RepID=UPI0013B0658C|nr:autotransporter-associated beta strand repeat-containing protein [Polynucleobacter necessarius]